MPEKEIVFLNEHGDIEFCEYMDLPRMERNLQILEGIDAPFRIINPVLNICKKFKGEIVQIENRGQVLFHEDKEEG